MQGLGFGLGLRGIQGGIRMPDASLGQVSCWQSESWVILEYSDSFFLHIRSGNRTSTLNPNP